MSWVFLGKEIIHTFGLLQNSSPGKSFQSPRLGGKTLPEARISICLGLMIYSQVTISVCWSVERKRQQTLFYSRPLKNHGTGVSSHKENKERWGIILNHLIVNKPPDVSSKPTEKRGLVQACLHSRMRYRCPHWTWISGRDKCSRRAEI